MLVPFAISMHHGCLVTAACSYLPSIACLSLLQRLILYISHIEIMLSGSLDLISCFVINFWIFQFILLELWNVAAAFSQHISSFYCAIVSFIGAGGWIEFSQTTQCDIPEDGHLHTPPLWEPEISFVCFVVSYRSPPPLIPSKPHYLWLVHAWAANCSDEH